MATVLVTGASRGIGRATALRLEAAGWDVLAGVRSEADGEALRAAAQHARIEPLILDVTDVSGLADALPATVDALVNNAGVVVQGPLEALGLDDLRRQLEVNVVGQMGVTQALLPRLRAARGRVVFVSSISGRMASPLIGAYVASKFALEGLADSLRLELRPFGVRVSLVEPGAIETDIWRNMQEDMDATEARTAPEHLELYGAQIAGMRKTTARVARQTTSSEKVAAAIERALTARRPRARYLVGLDARVQAAAAALPTPVSDAFVSAATGQPRRGTG